MFTYETAEPIALARYRRQVSAGWGQGPGSLIGEHGQRDGNPVSSQGKVLEAGPLETLLAIETVSC